MSEKRYRVMNHDDYELDYIADSQQSFKKVDLYDCCDLLNENEQLKKQKARYKRLSEIRNEEINNRILTIKEFIDNCSNEEVKKELEDLFYSEVNEYDLSSENRKLLNENEQLKQQLTSILELIKKIEDYTHDIKLIGDDGND